METDQKQQTAAATNPQETPSGGTTTPTPGAPGTNVTKTKWQEIAEPFLNALAELEAALPPEEMPEQAARALAKSHRSTTRDFIGAAVTAVTQIPELQSAGGLDVEKTQDTLQFFDAFGPVQARIGTLGKRLKFTFISKKAIAGAPARQVYAVSKGLVRGANGEAVGVHIDAMKLAGRIRSGSRKQKPAGSQKEALTVVA